MGSLYRLAHAVEAPPAWRHVPRGLARALPRAIAAGGDALACDVLLALERVAPQPLAGFAALERDRLEAAGVAPVRGGEDAARLPARLRAATLPADVAALLDRALPVDAAVFAAALARDDDVEPELLEHGPRVVESMLAWKLGEGDGQTDRWTLGDLRELMLDWLPGRLAATDEAVLVAGDAITAYLHLLAQRDRLDAPVPLPALEAAVARLRPRLEHACRPPDGAGLPART